MILTRALGLRTRRITWKNFSTSQRTWSPVGMIVPPFNVEEFTIKNEPVLSYTVGSKERRVLESTLKRYAKDTVEVPIVIGGKEYKTDKVVYQVSPFNHQAKIAKFYHATPELVNKAIGVAVKAQREWDKVSFNDRFKLWLKAADIVSGAARQKLNSATILGQAKTVVQAEIDASAELADFLRFNALYAKDLLKWQPISENPKVIMNSMRHRGLEGFVAAISPFNFTAIGGNLAYTPALMGCSVLWKPSDTAVLANYRTFEILKEAGLPDGVVNFLPSDGPVFGDAITSSPHLAAINFTGSVPTFQRLWTQVGKNLPVFKNFPRLVGEVGGKNFHLIHPSADFESAVNSTLRSAFEFSGQKCSACSRVYVPQSMWGKFRDAMSEEMKKMKIGDPTDFSVFTSAVIDEKAFDRIQGYVDHARKNLKIVQGGNYNKKDGYFIEPTLVETSDPTDKIMREEIFGPVVTVYVYPDAKCNEMLELIDTTTPFALTGAIFAQDEAFLKSAAEAMKYSSGNFYINDRSTGAVVGQQPFGGSRHSGTNDKAGAPGYVQRFTSPQAVKQAFVPYKEWKYPYMEG